jgi:hypothetical protein
LQNSKWSGGEKQGRNCIPQKKKKNSMEDLVGNEENG